MPTIDSPEIIKELLRSDGNYSEDGEQDPQAVGIWSYTNAWGNQAFYINYKTLTLRQSDHVIFPILLWSRGAGLTDEGRKVLAS